MIYFSELKGKKVKTEDGVLVGLLEDIIFLVGETPDVTKLVIKDNFKKELIVPVEYLVKINQEIIIKKNFQISELSANELFVVKNLLDKQIIDLTGSKIVRVNDVAFQDKGGFYLAGVDIGLLGILRWFKTVDLLRKFFNFFGLKIKPTFLSWADIQPIELARGHVMLKKREEKLVKIRAEDLADYLERTNIANIRKVLKILDEKKAAKVINHLNLNYRTTLFKHFKPEKSAVLLSYLEPDDATDILLTLSKRRREEIIKYLPEEKKKEVNYLLKLSGTAVGNLLTTEFIKVEPQLTVREVINKIKKEAADFNYLNAIYVVNQQNQLVGVFNIHELLLQDFDTPVYKFMIQNIVVIHLTTPEEIVLKKMLKYKLQVLPVINEKKEILGIITIDDLSEHLLAKLKL